MIDTPEEVQESISNNQGDLQTTEEVSTESKETSTGEVSEEQKTTPETGEEKPEFSDENMQKRFTQKMQELSEKEKKIEGILTHANDKAKAFDVLATNPDFRKWYEDYKLKSSGQVTPNITDEEWVEATQDKAKFQELIDKRVKVQKDPELTTLKRDVSLMKLATDIDNFANSENENHELLHPDFWQLDEKGLIEPYLAAFKSMPVSGAQKIEWAWKLARHDTRDSDAITKAHKLVEEKKNASGEKGVSLETKTISKKPMSLREFYKTEVKRLGMNEAP